MDQTLVFKLLTVFSASVLGSLHCVSMCGGLMLSAAPTLGYQLYYHGFRLLGYLSVGAMAGLIGSITFKENFPPFLELLLAMLICVILLYSGFHLFFRNNLPEYKLKFLSKLSSKGMHFGFSKKSIIQPACIGFFSALLPCAWLYSYVAIAATSKTMSIGSMTLFAFWLGTLPALLGGRILIQALASKLGGKANKVVAISFILIAFYSFFERIHALGHSAHSPTWYCK